MSTPPFADDRPLVVIPPAEAGARAEERERFYFFVLAVAVASLVMGLGYALLGDLRIALTGLVFSLLMLGLRTWTLQDDSPARLLQAVQLATAGGLAFLLLQQLVFGEAVAGWYLPLLPLGVVIFCGVAACSVWLLLTAGSLLLVAWATQAGLIATGQPAAAPLDLIARGVMMIFIVAFAITARRSRDNHVRLLNDNLAALQRARQEAEQANAAKSSFLATMSHELRTPLNAVIGLNSLMLESQLPTLQQRQAELACQAGETMLHIINEILDFSRIESGRLELERSVFSPRQVMEECLGLMAARAGEKRLRLRSEIEVPPWLWGDAARLRQVLLNLLGNAIKFTPSGEIVLRCSEHPSRGSRWLFVEVRDTGIGIDDGALARIFQPFEQADASTTRRFGGTGLGLAICRGLVTTMGGKLGVESAPGMGSSFWFELPFGEPSAEAIASSQRAPATVAHTGQARVLLAEDNSTSQFVALEMFRRLGHEVVLVDNGQEAVIEATTQRFDIIFLDCNMPVLDGFEAARAIRALETPGRHIPIIAMTALAYKSDRDNCLAAGMDDCLTKPVRLQDLGRTLERWLGAAPDSAGASAASAAPAPANGVAPARRDWTPHHP